MIADGGRVSAADSIAHFPAWQLMCTIRIQQELLVKRSEVCFILPGKCGAPGIWQDSKTSLELSAG